MNKNKLCGIALIVAAAVLVGLCVTMHDGLVVRCLGKAVWFLPYAALVTGIGRLVRA